MRKTQKLITLFACATITGLILTGCTSNGYVETPNIIDEQGNPIDELPNDPYEPNTLALGEEVQLAIYPLINEQMFATVATMNGFDVNQDYLNNRDAQIGYSDFELLPLAGFTQSYDNGQCKLEMNVSNPITGFFNGFTPTGSTDREATEQALAQLGYDATASEVALFSTIDSQVMEFLKVQTNVEGRSGVAFVRAFNTPHEMWVNGDTYTGYPVIAVGVSCDRVEKVVEIEKTLTEVYGLVKAYSPLPQTPTEDPSDASTSTEEEN